MDRRDRFLRIIKDISPDRVTIALFITDQGHFISQIYNDLVKYSYFTTQFKIIEI